MTALRNPAPGEDDPGNTLQFDEAQPTLGRPKHGLIIPTVS
jgi:hypothetical protein